MARYDFKSPRLYVDAPFQAGITLPLSRNQENYLGNVLRLSAGDAVLAFNGHDGEWKAAIEGRKRPDRLRLESLVRPQEPATRLAYVFAPLKHERLDYMVQKAVEMGAAALTPVMTRFTQVSRVNSERMRANAIEAAEQCGILTLPRIDPPSPLERYLTGRDAGRLLVFCDEDAESTDPVAALRTRANEARNGVDVLIGPEGGFAEEERTALLKQPATQRLSLGPRILRADTAAVAALALVNAAFEAMPAN